MDCGREVRNERSYRFRRPLQLSHITNIQTQEPVLPLQPVQPPPTTSPLPSANATKSYSSSYSNSSSIHSLRQPQRPTPQNRPRPPTHSSHHLPRPTTLRHLPSAPKGLRIIAKGCRASARPPWYHLPQIRKANPAPSPHPKPTSSVSHPHRHVPQTSHRPHPTHPKIQHPASSIEPPATPPPYRIARYAWNNDYHDLIEAKLRTLADFLTAHGGTQRPYVDTGPVLERDFASESGLGWGGKSTMQIHRHLGTWFFLADILTTLELPPDAPATDHCGKCTRCITACPTQAITAPRRMDARRCISYLTIESKGPIPLEFRHAIGDRIYGCDTCLDACPWNRHAQASHEATFQARATIFAHTLRDFLTLTDDTFRALFAKSPIKRIKRPAFLRNVCVALGNTGTPSDLPALELAAQDENPLIAEHAQWAVGEIRTRHAPK